MPPSTLPLQRMNALRLADVTRDSFFQYASSAMSFTLGSETFTQSIQIQNDAHFLCVSLSYTNTAESGNITATTAIPYRQIDNGGGLIQITDGSSQRFLSNIALPVSALFGRANAPRILELTHLFRANGTIGFTLVGMGAAAPFAGQVIRLVWSGFKVPRNQVAALDAAA